MTVQKKKGKERQDYSFDLSKQASETHAREQGFKRKGFAVSRLRALEC